MSYNVLVVESDDKARVILRDFLQKNGYDVSTTASGYHAVNLVKDCTFDCLLINHKLGDYNGLELIKVIRGLSARIGLILLVAQNPDAYCSDCDEYDIWAVLEKPAKPKELLQYMKEACEYAQMPQDVIEEFSRKVDTEVVAIKKTHDDVCNESSILPPLLTAEEESKYLKETDLR